MSSSIYSLLGFPASSQSMVQDLSPTVLVQMNLMPTLVNTWQQEDIATANTDGYYQNPAQSGTQIVWNCANTIASLANNQTGTSDYITTKLSNIFSLASTISTTTANNFMLHTNRMSNVVPMDAEIGYPHYQTSIGYGKMMMYLTNKTDNIQNNSPMIGSFTSIFQSNVINANANTFLSYTNILTATTNTTNSSISSSDANALYDVANSIHNMMTTYRQQDINFYTNTKVVMDRYSAVSSFSNLGQTETDLINTHIGTDKIKTRLANS